MTDLTQRLKSLGVEAGKVEEYDFAASQMNEYSRWREITGLADAALEELVTALEENVGYVHNLEGWLAQVRERSAKLLAERNELRRLLAECRMHYALMEKQTQTALAKLAEREGRRCGTCYYENEGVARTCDNAVAVFGLGEDYDHPDCYFACIRWEACT
jgi:DNA repair exonuclease SbcCD ATPase subunit